MHNYTRLKYIIVKYTVDIMALKKTWNPKEHSSRWSPQAN